VAVQIPIDAMESNGSSFARLSLIHSLLSCQPELPCLEEEEEETEEEMEEEATSFCSAERVRSLDLLC